MSNQTLVNIIDERCVRVPAAPFQPTPLSGAAAMLISRMFNQTLVKNIDERCVRARSAVSTNPPERRCPG